MVSELGMPSCKNEVALLPVHGFHIFKELDHSLKHYDDSMRINICVESTIPQF